MGVGLVYPCAFNAFCIGYIISKDVNVIFFIVIFNYAFLLKLMIFNLKLLFGIYTLVNCPWVRTIYLKNK